MLRLGRCRLDVSVSTLIMVDSLEMTDEDRTVIVDRGRRCDKDRIVLTDGTDTTVETTSALAGNIPEGTIVLTGATVPYALGSSDGLFNIGSALSFVQVLLPGVYGAINGRCFSWNDVRKNREAGTFEPLEA